MVQNPDGTWKRVGPIDNAPPGVGSSFQHGTWPCVKPPWGELSAVNVNTGDIAWHVPLGSYAELDALGVPHDRNFQFRRLDRYRRGTRIYRRYGRQEVPCF